MLDGQPTAAMRASWHDEYPLADTLDGLTWLFAAWQEMGGLDPAYARVNPHSKRSARQLLHLTTVPTATSRRARHGHTVGGWLHVWLHASLR